jgi:hypothetical protein
MAKSLCFGQNKDRGLLFFAEIHLVLAMSDVSKFAPKESKTNNTVEDPSEIEDEPEGDVIDEIDLFDEYSFDLNVVD